MTPWLRSTVCFTTALWLIGCSQMIPIDEVPSSGTIERPLTKDQIKQAIEEGAYNAGWTPKEVGKGQIAASYRIRAHDVTVMINYSEDVYQINYESSREMKVQCSEEDYTKSKNIIVTGRQSCPAFQDPLYIHENYGEWIMNLKRSIDQSIIFAD